MTLTLTVEKADLTLESAFAQPEFGLFKDTPRLLQHLFSRLQPQGIRLQDMKIERGGGSVGEFHLNCTLYSFQVGVRVHMDKIGVVWLNVTQEQMGPFSALAVEALSAVRDHQPEIAFRTHTMGVVLHGRLEGTSAKDYLARFLKDAPTGLGPQTGNGTVMYFGPADDRILSSVTLDLSALLPDGLFVRPHVVWDARKVEIAALPSRAAAFVRQVLGSFDLEIEALRI